MINKSIDVNKYEQNIKNKYYATFIAIYFLNYYSVTIQYTCAYSCNKIHNHKLKCYSRMLFDINEVPMKL